MENDRVIEPAPEAWTIKREGLDVKHMFLSWNIEFGFGEPLSNAFRITLDALCKAERNKTSQANRLFPQP